MSRSKNVESGKDRTSSTNASDEAYEQKNTAFWWTNDLATWPDVMSRNVRD